MRGHGILAGALCALLLATSGTGFVSAAKPSVTKNCVRLVGDTGSKGRLEITTKDPRFTGTNANKGRWFPVCQTGFDDGLAQVMCELLGFKYGRSYYTQEVAYPSKQSYTFSAAYLSCYRKDSASSVPLRHLRAGDAADGDEARAVTTMYGDAVGPEQHRSRSDRSLAFLLYYISTPKKAPYECRFNHGPCGSSGGAFAGVECSNKPLPPAPSPPPSPPSPPPYDKYIRYIGGHYPISGSLERNLCPPGAPEGFCRTFGRIELLVDAPGGGGGQVWAPLCAVSDELRDLAATITCKQAYGWPVTSITTPIMVSGRAPSEAPYDFRVPTGDVTEEGEFNSAAFQGWATLTGLRDVRPSLVQDGNITVSATPCASLFAVDCQVLFARRRQLS